jgi:hypothetical protein
MCTRSSLFCVPFITNELMDIAETRGGKIDKTRVQQSSQYTRTNTNDVFTRLKTVKKFGGRCRHR